ncbi:hypothetical protein [Streptomyces sp. NPDC101165]|uniref:hypothetical protein n=1 Tax=Streptomyces sp. NPDC101165 TaxID=3366119 RepID=UPI0038132D85
MEAALNLGETIAAGMVVAGFAALLGLVVTVVFTSRREQAQRRLERDLAAAAELYRCYGELFAVWKAWNNQARREDVEANLRPARPHPPDEQRWSELLSAASRAEGGFEALLIRITQERDLNGRDRELATLWCLRQAAKQLRYAIRQGEQLVWWRSDNHYDSAGQAGYRGYQAFKTLTSAVAGMLLEPSRKPRGKGDERLAALREVTGDGKTFTTLYKEQLDRENKSRSQRPNLLNQLDDWEWVVITETLYPAGSA